MSDRLKPLPSYDEATDESYEVYRRDEVDQYINELDQLITLAASAADEWKNEWLEANEHVAELEAERDQHKSNAMTAEYLLSETINALETPSVDKAHTPNRVWITDDPCDGWGLEASDFLGADQYPPTEYIRMDICEEDLSVLAEDKVILIQSHNELRAELDEARELASKRKVEANALLTEYSEWLMKHGYLDCDWLVECGDEQTAVDEFLSERMPTNGL